MAQQLRLSEVGQKIDGSKARFNSMDVRYRSNGDKKEPSLKMLAEDPVKEVEARLGGLEMGPLGIWLLKHRMRPVSKYDDRLTMTMAERINTGDIKKQMYCQSCQTWHSRALPEELAIIVGDSQAAELNVGHDGRKVGDEYHVDHYILPGRELDELCAGVMYFYAHVECSLKVVIAAGYNNYLHNQSRKEIMEAFSRFHQLLEELDHMHRRPRGSSTAVVATMIMCPAMVLRRGEPLDRSKEYFNSEGWRIQQLNRQILDLNESVGYGEQSTPLCESLGRRSSWKNGRRRFSIQRNWFRESKRENMLHLSKEYKYCLHKKLHRTIKRMVRSSSLVSLKKSSTKNKYQLVKSLKNLTIDGSEELKAKSRSKAIHNSTSPTKPDAPGRKHRSDDPSTVEAGMKKLSLSAAREKDTGKYHNDSSKYPRKLDKHQGRGAKSAQGESIAKAKRSAETKGSSGSQTGKGRASTAKGAILREGLKESRRKNSPPMTRNRLSTTSYPPDEKTNAGKKDDARQKRRAFFQLARGRLEKAQSSGSVVRVKKTRLSSK